jgi:hypothetical protein
MFVKADDASADTYLCSTRKPLAYRYTAEERA